MINNTIGIDDLTPLERWENHPAKFKAKCENGLCVSFEHPIDCEDCRKGD